MNNRPNQFALQFGHQGVQPSTMPQNNYQSPNNQSPYHTSSQNYPPQQTYPYQPNNTGNQYGNSNNMPQQQNSFINHLQQNNKPQKGS